jgi:hypothetical protein
VSDIKTAFGAGGQTFTITLASLATGSSRESTSIDNTTNLYIDALVMLQVKFANTAVGTDPWVYVYGYGTVDGGTTWPDAVTGTDAAITLNSPANLRLLGAVSAAQNATRKGGPWSMASVFGGILPAKWGIVVRNSSNIALTATEADHAKLWQGVYQTVL